MRLRHSIFLYVDVIFFTFTVADDNLKHYYYVNNVLFYK